VRETRLTVPEMHCEGCRAAVAGALQGLPGVTAVEVDLDRKLVTVKHDPEHTATERLCAAVEDQGYEVAGCEAP